MNEHLNVILTEKQCGEIIEQWCARVVVGVLRGPCALTLRTWMLLIKFPIAPHVNVLGNENTNKWTEPFWALACANAS